MQRRMQTHELAVRSPRFGTGTQQFAQLLFVRFRSNAIHEAIEYSYELRVDRTHENASSATVF